MEQHNPPIGGFEAGHVEDLSGDARAIHQGIQASRLGEHDEDNATARRIAAQLHGGQWSALYGLASSGAIDNERLHRELEAEYTEQEDPAVREWIHWLGAYCLRREDKGPIGGWHESIADYPAVEPREVGAVVLADEVEERDPFPWRDAARWQPDGGPDELSGSDGMTSAVMDELFARLPEHEFGSHEEMGWCGLLRHEGRPGGVVLHQNQYGRRSAWTTDSDDDLASRWRQLQEEHEAYQSATQARESDSRDESPKVWVGSLADYTAGYLHGAWLDATLDPADLTKAVDFVLRNSHEPDAEEYGIFDYDEFGSEVTSLLGEYPSLKTVSKIAQGIAEHGQAFAAWAAYVGPEQEEQLDRFEDHYLGEWDSMEAYAENLLEECEGYRVVDEAPEWLRPYLKIDVEMYAQDLGYDLHVVEKPEGGVWVFDTRV